MFQQPEGVAPQAMEARLNWTNAVVRVLLINAFVEVAFTPPLHAFELALHSLPVAEEDGSFLWSYVWNDGDREVRIDLTGRPAGSNVEWQVRVTDSAATPPLDHALWFRGESNASNRSGYWVFFDLEGLRTQAEVARIDWRVTNDRDAELAITNRNAQDEGVGDTLTYRVDGNEASVVYDDVSEDAILRIVWDTISGAGSMIAPDYHEGERACWDDRQQDVECTETIPAAF
ncbi:MAG: hypothetical protein R3E12_19655 [Candidatus Eisenbacteria bacterium]